MTRGVTDGPDSPAQQEIYLQTIGMNDLVADGALHEHEVKLLLLILNGVFFAGLPADETHRCVRQDRLRDDRGNKSHAQTSRSCVETLTEAVTKMSKSSFSARLL